jgi:hypothetical protein
VLTQQNASARSVDRNDNAMSRNHDARNIRTADVDECQDCRKSLRFSTVLESLAISARRERSARESLMPADVRCRGLRVSNFCKKNIFIVNGLRALARPADGGAVANRASTIRKSFSFDRRRRRRPETRASARSDAELRLQEVVDGLRVGLAAG